MVPHLSCESHKQTGSLGFDRYFRRVGFLLKSSHEARKDTVKSCSFLMSGWIQ